MPQPPSVNRVITGLTRAELAGVNAHTLTLALDRLERDAIDLNPLNERQIAALLLDRVGYPVSVAEFTLFLAQPQAIAPATLLAEDITDQYAPHYMRWLAAFLDDPEQATQRNASTVLRWLVANRRTAIVADQDSLNNLRRLADDTATSVRASAPIVYALGLCGTIDDYERVTRHAEVVIEHDREHLDLVAEGLYRLYPPALISALQFFLEHTNPAARKQFNTGMHLLAKVAEIEDRQFWTTYYNDMTGIVDRLTEIGARNPAIERVLDLIEKNLATSTLDGLDEA